VLDKNYSLHRSTNEQYEGALVATVDDIVKKETQAT